MKTDQEILDKWSELHNSHNASDTLSDILKLVRWATEGMIELPPEERR